MQQDVKKPVILAIGDADPLEFAPTIELLRARTTLHLARSVHEGQTYLHRNSVRPEWVVLLQRLPGDFRRELCSQLWRMNPLLRIVRILGTWCEGEVRTGIPWPGTTRMYWHQAPGRIAHELWAHGRGLSTWAHPLTMSDDDRLLSHLPPNDSTANGLIAICTHLADTAESLADACAERGFASVWLQPGRSILARGWTACIFDFAHSSDREFGELTKQYQRMQQTPVIALIGFVRSDDCQRALDAGATAVVGKPYMLADLLHTLDQATASGSVAEQRPPARAV